MTSRRDYWARRLRAGARLLYLGQFAALDIWMRGPSAYMAHPRMAGALLASCALLSLVLHLKRVPQLWPRVVVALAFGFLVVSLLGYYRYYHAPLDVQAAIAARHAWSDVRPMLLRAAPVFGIATLVVSVLQYALFSAAAPIPVAMPLLAIPLVCGLGVLGSLRSGTAEFRAVDAAWVLVRTRDVRTTSDRSSLPEVQTIGRELPNVLLLITESVRASDACQERGCSTGPELDRLLPDRVTLQKARSLSSYTAIALSALLTGQTQIQSRSDLAKAPDIFDWVHAVRSGSVRYEVRYWSSQLAGVLERGDLGSLADEVVTAETLLGHPLTDIEDAVAAVLDRRVADHCERHLIRSKRPQFLVVHVSGTHAPYAFDDNGASFKPWRRQVTWSGLGELHNAYLNAILEQDRSLGRCLSAFLKAVAPRPWIVVYTSDHGEAFGEHSAIHHGQNLFDEQIRVPLIVAHGGGSLSAEQVGALRANATAQVTHLDLLPTLLDLWGLREHFALQHWVGKLPGRSLLTSLGPLGLLPITNCTELFPCPINTWGLLTDGRKLAAQSWDGNWRCLSLLAEERERGLAECSDLVKAACGIFPRLPNGNVSGNCAN
jgi:hypothetical protein